jgi:hypothetical protein
VALVALVGLLAVPWGPAGRVLADHSETCLLEAVAQSPSVPLETLELECAALDASWMLDVEFSDNFAWATVATLDNPVGELRLYTRSAGSWEPVVLPEAAWGEAYLDYLAEVEGQPPPAAVIAPESLSEPNWFEIQREYWEGQDLSSVAPAPAVVIDPASRSASELLYAIQQAQFEGRTIEFLTR